MVIANQFIQTPYMKYSVRLTCVAVRRLTIMEWTILRIANDYATNPNYRTRKLSHFFEIILGMERSELLIRPCVNSLLRLKLIEITNYSATALASDTCVGDILLTDTGLEALLHNYLPGTSAETGECVYYDLLTGSLSDALPNPIFSNYGVDVEKITDQSTFEIPFPSDEIATSINRGHLFPSKYKDMSSIAQDVVCAESEVVWNTGILTLDRGEDGNCICNYPLTRDVYAQLRKMTSAPFKSHIDWNIWQGHTPIPNNAQNGKAAMKEIEKYIGYSDYVFVHSGIWAEFSKKFKKQLKGITCFVFGATNLSIDADDHPVVYLPFAPADPNVFLMFAGHKMLCAAQEQLSIEGKSLDLWFSYRKSCDESTQEWLTRSLLDSHQMSMEMAAVLLLPLIDLDANTRCESIKIALKGFDSYIERLAALEHLESCCSLLRINPPDYYPLLTCLIEVMDFQSADSVADSLSLANERIFSRHEGSLYAELIVQAAENYGFRSGIWNLHKILACVFQCKDADIATFLSNLETRIFSSIPREAVDDLFNLFSNSIPEPIPEISPIAREYNHLIQGLKLVSGLLGGVNWYGEQKRDELLNGLIACNVLQKVQQTVCSLQNIIEALLNRGCSVFSVDGSCYGITERLSMIAQMLSCFIYPDGDVAAIYLIDTCVFLHSPDILAYFRDDETIRVPFTVLRELDYHKDNNQDPALRKCAAFACKQIEKRTLLAQKEQNDRFAVEPCDYPELLPDGFASHKHDDLILSAALRYKLLNPRILTDDTNFRNIARTQGIEPIQWDKFIVERGGTATRGSGDSFVDDSLSEGGDDSTPVPPSASTTNSEDISPAMTVERLHATHLYAGAKRFGLNNSEISLLQSHKMKTCGDLIKADELYLKSLFKKKKVNMAQHLLDVRRKMKAEADRLSNFVTTP